MAAFVARRQRFFPILVLFAALAAGFATATLKSARVVHTVPAKPMYSVALKGFVETHEERERTDRFVLRVEEMDAPRGQTRIERVRLSVKKGTAPDVGSFVEMKARLLPPLSPLRPGSYDFGRDMYFQGIGASGFAMGAIKTVEAPRSGGIYLKYAGLMQSMRDAIDARIRSVLSGRRLRSRGHHRHQQTGTRWLRRDGAGSGDAETAGNGRATQHRKRLRDDCDQAARDGSPMGTGSCGGRAGDSATAANANAPCRCHTRRKRSAGG